MEEIRIETQVDLEHYYPSWRETPDIVIKMLITNNNYTMIPYIMEQVSTEIEFHDLATDFYDDPNILQWLDQMAIQYGQQISYNYLAGECLDDQDLFQTMINLADQRHQELDLNYLAWRASRENNIIMLDKFIQAGANDITNIIGGAVSHNSLESFRYLVHLIISSNYPISYTKVLGSLSNTTDLTIVYELIVHMKNIGQSIKFETIITNLVCSKDSSSNEIKQFELWIIEQMKTGYFPVNFKAIVLMATDLNLIDLLQYALNKVPSEYYDNSNIINILYMESIAQIASKNGSLPIIQLVLEKLITNYENVFKTQIILFAVSNNHNDIVQFLITYFIKKDLYINLTSVLMDVIRKHNIVLLEWIFNNTKIDTIDLVQLSIQSVKCDDIHILKYITSKYQQLYENIYEKFIVDIVKLVTKTSPEIKQFLIQLVHEITLKYENIEKNLIKNI